MVCTFMFCSLRYIFTMFCVNQLGSALSLIAFLRLLEHVYNILICTFPFQLIYYLITFNGECLTKFELCLSSGLFIYFVRFFSLFYLYSVLSSNRSLRPCSLIFGFGLKNILLEKKQSANRLNAYIKTSCT